MTMAATSMLITTRRGSSSGSAIVVTIPDSDAQRCSFLAVPTAIYDAHGQVRSESAVGCVTCNGGSGSVGGIILQPSFSGYPRRSSSKLGEVTITLSNGIRVTLSNNGLLFNATSLFRESYRMAFAISSSRKTWRMALHNFLISPTFRAVITLLEEEGKDIPRLVLIKQDGARPSTSNSWCCHNQSDIYLHIGLLSLALLDLHNLSALSLRTFHLEVRDIVTTMARSILFIPSPCSEGEERDKEIRVYARAFSKILKSVTNFGEITSIRPPPWILIVTGIAVASAAPRKTGESSAATTEEPLLTDSQIMTDVALNIVYICLDHELAKKGPAWRSKEKTAMRSSSCGVESEEYHYPPEMEKMVADLVADNSAAC